MTTRLPRPSPARDSGRRALTAIYPDAGNPFALTYLREEEGLEPWTVPEVWLINSPERDVNHYVDITGTSDRKVAAVTAALGEHAVGQVRHPGRRAGRQLQPGRGQAPSPLRWRRPCPM